MITRYMTTETKELSMHEKLIDIQQRLTVPKTRENSFGGFNYRSVEDIEIALKPLLREHKLFFGFTDTVVAVGDRVYVKAKAVLSDGEHELSAEGWAREAEKPKAKTDDAQLTGGCSSYARKYAAQGLFLIDDGKGDPDNKGAEEGATLGISSLNVAKQKLFKAFRDAGIDDSTIMMEKIQQAIGKDSVDNLADVEKVIKHLEKK